MQIVVGEAEAPALLVVRRPVGDEVGAVGQREEVGAQLLQCEALPHGCAVAHEVQVRPGEIDDAIAAVVLDEGIADVPLGRDDPVEGRGARRDFVDLEREFGAHAGERLAHSCTRDAPGDREEVDAELVHLGSVDRNVAAAHTASMPCFRRMPPTQSCSVLRDPSEVEKCGSCVRRCTPSSSIWTKCGKRPVRRCDKSPLRWTIFVDPLMARIEGFDLRDQFSWFADRGHEIAMHTHHHLLQGEPGHTTGFLMGQPLDEGDIHRCLSENFEYLCERGHTPKGFLSGNWLVLGTTVEWLSATGFEYDSTLRTYSGPHPNSTLVAERAASQRQPSRRPRGDPHDVDAQTAGAGRPHVAATIGRRGRPELRALLPPRLRPRRRQEARGGQGTRNAAALRAEPDGASTPRADRAHG